MVNKSHFYEMLENVRKKILALHTDNYIKKALVDNTLNKIESKIGRLPENELAYEYYPPLFLFVYNNYLSVINKLNRDILLIKDNSSSKSFKDLTTFLEATEKEVRNWKSGLFEVFIKSRLLKKFPKDYVKLDKNLPNGRNSDAAIKLNNKWMNFEVTILSSSDEDYKAYERYNESLKKNPDEVLVRPGKYDTPNSKSPSLYYDESRIFEKIYDKIADEKLNVDKSQMSPDEPNILFLFIGDVVSTLEGSPAIGWAFDELFADQPKGKENSFIKWIINEIKKLCLGNEWYHKNLDKVISAPGKLSGVIIFNGCNGDIIESRINYNASKKNKISHKEMAEVEEIFKEKPCYIC